MFDFLKNLFAKKETHVRKAFQFLVLENAYGVKKNTWYRLEHWQSQNFLKMETEYTDEWKVYSLEEPIVGVAHDNRIVDFIMMGDKPDFKLTCQKEPDNAFDKNAIKIIGTATVDGGIISKVLGYLSAETAQELKDEEVDIRPVYVKLPTSSANSQYEHDYFELSVKVLVRSQKYKNKHKK